MIPVSCRRYGRLRSEHHHGLYTLWAIKQPSMDYKLWKYCRYIIQVLQAATWRAVTNNNSITQFKSLDYFVKIIVIRAWKYFQCSYRQIYHFLPISPNKFSTNYNKFYSITRYIFYEYFIIVFVLWRHQMRAWENRIQLFVLEMNCT